MCLCFLFLAYSQRSLISPLPQPEHEIEALARCNGLHLVREIARVDHGEAGALRDDEPVATRKAQIRAREIAAERKVHRDLGVVDVLRRRLARFRAVLPECSAVAVRICGRVPQDERMAVVGVDAHSGIQVVDGGSEHVLHDRRRKGRESELGCRRVASHLYEARPCVRYDRL